MQPSFHDESTACDSDNDDADDDDDDYSDAGMLALQSMTDINLPPLNVQTLLVTYN